MRPSFGRGYGFPMGGLPPPPRPMYTGQASELGSTVSTYPTTTSSLAPQTGVPPYVVPQLIEVEMKRKSVIPFLCQVFVLLAALGMTVAVAAFWITMFLETRKVPLLADTTVVSIVVTTSSTTLRPGMIICTLGSLAQSLTYTRSFLTCDYIIYETVVVIGDKILPLHDKTSWKNFKLFIPLKDIKGGISFSALEGAGPGSTLDNLPSVAKELKELLRSNVIAYGVLRYDPSQRRLAEYEVGFKKMKAIQDNTNNSVIFIGATVQSRNMGNKLVEEVLKIPFIDIVILETFTTRNDREECFVYPISSTERYELLNSTVATLVSNNDGFSQRK